MIALCVVLLAAAPAAAKKDQASPARPGQLILYQQTGYNGDYYTIDVNRTTVQTEWNIRSIAIHEGEKWQICARTRYRDCIDLTQSLPDASVVGLQGQLGSIRRVPAGQ